MVGWLGTIPLAAHQVMITISQLFYLVLSGMAAAMAIRVSHFMGQKDYAAVRLNAYDGFRLNLLFSLCMGLPVLLLRHQIGGWFNDNVEVQPYAAICRRGCISARGTLSAASLHLLVTHYHTETELAEVLEQ